MNIISCILAASSGSAKINGFDTFEQSLEIRKIIGYLPETPPLYSDMIVSDYLNFQKWLHNSNKGQSFVYFKGYLAQEKSHANFEKEILRFTNTVMRLSEKGLISLVQKRLGVANYEYIAIKK